MIHRRVAAPGHEHRLYALVAGIRGGEYEFRLAVHRDELELPFLALDFLDEVQAGLLRLREAAKAGGPLTDGQLSKLNVRPTPTGAAVMWRRGVLARVEALPPSGAVSTVLQAALHQVEDWRAEVIALYGLRVTGSSQRRSPANRPTATHHFHWWVCPA